MKVKALTVFMLALALFMSACGKSDADLTKAATDKLAADKVTGVTVAVNDGVATLTGEVADGGVKSKAESSVKTVEGIKSVTNSITVKVAPPPAAPPEDKMLEGSITEALKKANLTTVTVTVGGGNVTLGGTVKTKEELTKAMQAANEATKANPKKIVNQIQVAAK